MLRPLAAALLLACLAAVAAVRVCVYCLWRQAACVCVCGRATSLHTLSFRSHARRSLAQNSLSRPPSPSPRSRSPSATPPTRPPRRPPWTPPWRWARRRRSK